MACSSLGDLSRLSTGREADFSSLNVNLSCVRENDPTSRAHTQIELLDPAGNDAVKLELGSVLIPGTPPV
jgi:hypothetical protein